MKTNRVKEATGDALGWYLFGSEGYMPIGYQADPPGGMSLLFLTKGGMRGNVGLQMPEACYGQRESTTWYIDSTHLLLKK